ncbi:MAG: family 78 glycoside hydrolase catalytic domain [Sedimentisphaerales bacterium]|nr:family 78 glycoside hydrolase catalytic domain [Sedimentisphaerales bacterium]
MRIRILSLCAAVVVLGAFLSAEGASNVTVSNLRCEYLINPQGIDVLKPRLSWVLQAHGADSKMTRGVLQSACRILVASSPQRLALDEGDLWDSGKVISSRNQHVEYNGSLLKTRQRCYWKIRIWDGNGKVSEWSAPAQWTMGLLEPEDWQARWITVETEEDKPLKDCVWIWSDRAVRGDPSIMPPGRRWFRRCFTLPAGTAVAQATLSMTADNSFTAYLNGQQVLTGSDWQILVEATVTNELLSGDNVIAVIVTNGGEVPNPAGLIGYLTITFKDGTRHVVPVDTQWRTWNKEEKGWTDLAFDDLSWSAALSIARFGEGQWGTKVNALRSLPLLRTTFRIDKLVQRAELAICGLGSYEGRLNGRKLDDTVLKPGWTNYRKSVLYRVHDVTERLVPGENVLGVMLGNGMYNVTGGRYTKFIGSFGPPKLIVQLNIDYADGTSGRIISDTHWRTAPGPITFSCIYGGEDYDARQEQSGWDQSGFDDSDWKTARECEGPGGCLTTRSAPPIKVMETFKPVEITQPRPGVWVYDLGQNFSGWPKLSVSGLTGTTVKLITGELLDKNGLVSQRSSGGPVWFAYTLKGDGPEVWRPRFSYSGFRYVQVENGVPKANQAEGPGLPCILQLQGEFLYPDTAVVGQFSCSNTDVNRVHALILAAIKSNFKSVLTDCPHREKLGWLECSHLLAGCFIYNFDCVRFYDKIAQDMRETQLDNGLVPDIAPEYVVFNGGFRDSPEWGSATVLSPWYTWRMYGDSRILQEQYETMKRYVAYLGTQAKDHIIAYGLGDWYDIGPHGPGPSQLTSPGLTATGVYYQDINTLRQIAALLGQEDDARSYTRLAGEVKNAFAATFFNADTNQYDRNSQTASAMPLFLDLVEPERRALVLENLVDDIRARGNRVTAGDVGFHYVVQALLNGRRSDVLYDMLSQSEGPGYMYQLRKNATSLTEAWDTNPASSQNHCMLGHIEEWFYSGLLGIRSDTPGFRQILIQPQLVGDLSWARGHYDCPYGRIACAWQRDDDTLTLDLTIPPNTTATVFIPTRDAETITESGLPIVQATGVKLLRRQKNDVIFMVSSGVYQFQSNLREEKGKTRYR